MNNCLTVSIGRDSVDPAKRFLEQADLRRSAGGAPFYVGLATLDRYAPCPFFDQRMRSASSRSRSGARTDAESRPGMEATPFVSKANKSALKIDQLRRLMEPATSPYHAQSAMTCRRWLTLRE